MPTLETETHNLETSRRQLAYSKDLKTLVQENPRLIKNTLHALDEIKCNRTYELGEKIEPIRTDDITLELIQNRPYSEIYKATLPTGEEFCLKSEKQRSSETRSEAHKEYLSMEKANARLKDIKNVRTIDFQLAYQDKNRSLFVSRWENYEPLNEHLEKLWQIKDERQDPGTSEEILTLNHRIQELQKLFSDFHDFDEKNMFYDPQTKDIILFDLTFN